MYSYTPVSYVRERGRETDKGRKCACRVCMCASTGVCVHVHIYKYMYVYIYIYVCMYIYICTHIDTFIYNINLSMLSHTYILKCLHVGCLGRKVVVRNGYKQ